MRFFLRLLALGIVLAVMLLMRTHVQAQDFDIDALAHAIAIAETGDCTAGVGLHLNNCQSINGKSGYRWFASRDASYAYFKAMWLRVYGGHFPSWTDAKKYTGDADPRDWYCNVKTSYGFQCNGKDIAS